MSTKTTVVLALAAGFAGGVVSQRIVPAPPYAQAPTPMPKEVRVEEFVIVNENGLPRGAFGIDKKDGWPTIEIIDAKRHLNRTRWGDGADPFLAKANHPWRRRSSGLSFVRR
jgi:hypothetical protein